MDNNILRLECTNTPSDAQTRKAKKFGEGFTWSCVKCGKVYVLAQGKGSYWYWKMVGD